MATRIKNLSGGPFSLPAPYTGILQAGSFGVTGDSSVATTIANLGGVVVVQRSHLRVDVAQPGDSVTLPYLTAAAIPLADDKLLIGSPGGAAAPQSFSGDVTVSDSGATVITNGAVTGPKMAANAVSNGQLDPGVVQTVQIPLSNAQVKALRASPQQLVAAPGAGKVLIPVQCIVYMKYGGTNAFTANSGKNLSVQPVGGNAILNGAGQAFLQATASGYSEMTFAPAAGTDLTNSKTFADNVALQIANTGASEIAGNAANDNSLLVVLSYRVDTAPVGW